MPRDPHPRQAIVASSRLAPAIATGIDTLSRVGYRPPPAVRDSAANQEEPASQHRQQRIALAVVIKIAIAIIMFAAPS
jgi:hypothetical protein